MFVFFVLWLLLSVGITMLVTLYIQLAWTCPQVDNSPSAVTTQHCFQFGTENTGKLIIVL